MKYTLGILFSFLILTSTFSDWFLYSSFKANQEFIAQYFCINKDKPELNCKGKCHFTAEFEKQHGDNAEAPLPVFENKSPELIYTFSENKIVEYFFDFTLQLGHPSFAYELPSGYGFGVFHPPRI
jgi:hypothetical protein